MRSERLRHSWFAGPRTGPCGPVPALARCALLALGSLWACGPIDPAPQDQGAASPAKAHRPALQLAALSPPPSEPLSRRPTLVLDFSDYLEPDGLLSWNAVSLQSQGIVAWGEVRHEVAARRLVWQPLRPLEEGLDYVLVVNPEAVRGLAGAALAPLPAVRYRTVLGEAPPLADPDDVPAVSWQGDIAPLFEARCAPCHHDPQWRLVPLTRESLLAGRSTQVDRLLVRPHDPARSYLLHKILPQYPVRRFTVQPPPWQQDYAPLSAPEITLVERWIGDGALP